MRTYVTPDFSVTKFRLNQNVALCTDETFYNAVTVDCVVTSWETLWAGTNTDCNYDPEDGTSRTTVYEGQEYFIWIGKAGIKVAGNNHGNDLSLLKAILATAGIYSEQAGDGLVYHAAPYTAEISSNKNMS